MVLIDQEQVHQNAAIHAAQRVVQKEVHQTADHRHMVRKDVLINQEKKDQTDHQEDLTIVVETKAVDQVLVEHIQKPKQILVAASHLNVNHV